MKPMHLYYQTFCDHKIRAGFTVFCHHGSMTTTSSGILGKAFRGYLIYDVEGV